MSVVLSMADILPARQMLETSLRYSQLPTSRAFANLSVVTCARAQPARRRPGKIDGAYAKNSAFSGAYESFARNFIRS